MATYENIGGSKQYAKGDYKEIIEFRKKGVEYNGNLCVSDHWICNLYSGDVKVMRFISNEEPTEATLEKDIEFYEKMTFKENSEVSTPTTTFTSNESVEELNEKLTKL